MSIAPVQHRPAHRNILAECVRYAAIRLQQERCGGGLAATWALGAAERYWPIPLVLPVVLFLCVVPHIYGNCGWKRRPTGRWRCPSAMPSELPLWQGGLCLLRSFVSMPFHGGIVLLTCLRSIAV